MHALHGEQCNVGLEGLGDVVGGASAHGIHGGSHAAEGGHEHHGQVVIEGTDLAEQVHTRHPGHAQIGDDCIDMNKKIDFYYVLRGNHYDGYILFD